MKNPTFYQKGSVSTLVIALVILVIFVIAAGTVYSKKNPSLLSLVTQGSTTTPPVYSNATTSSSGTVVNTRDSEIGTPIQASYTTTLVSPFPGGSVYHNSTYGLTIPLPTSWAGYTVTTTRETFAGVTNLASIKFFVGGQNPLTINVFTKEQWNDIRIQETNSQVNGFGEGNYLGENSRYIFATNSIGGEEISLILTNTRFY